MNSRYDVQFQDQFGNWLRYQSGFGTIASARVSARQVKRLKGTNVRIIEAGTSAVVEFL